MILSDAYIGPKSRTERPRKTKIGTEVAHVTRVTTTFKVKRSKIKVTMALYSQRNEAGAAVTVRTYWAWGNYCYVASARRRARGLGAHGGGEGRDISCRHKHSLLLQMN